MRFVTLVSCLLVTHASIALAQDREFGAKVGPNFSVVTFDPDQADDYDRRIAIGGGGFAVLPLGNRLAVQIEALINPKGAKLFDPDENLTGAVLLHYLETPILMRINGPRRGAGAFHVFAGPYTGIRVSATRQISFVANSITSGTKTDMGEEVERFELGLVGGAGLDIGRRIVVDGRYAHGLTKLNTCRGQSGLCAPGDPLRIRNRALSFMIGARF